jgi:hypothetical protein
MYYSANISGADARKREIKFAGLRRAIFESLALSVSLQEAVTVTAQRLLILHFSQDVHFTSPQEVPCLRQNINHWGHLKSH